MSNCGSCGNVCPVPANGIATCSSGQCGISCDTGYTACSGKCVSLLTDKDNCGYCGVKCGTNQVCSNGTCVVTCPTGTTNCGGNCVDTTSDVS
ncbi:MAG: hypothetical protein COW42_10000, partial [Deltaproteobacteria bacterium CG17_big_fil_post_rev_8_21_14_2_50_63_7]